MTSFNTNFNRSAKDCKRPNAPTTFGPRLICTAAHILRSANNRKAIVINSAVIIKTLFAAMIAAGYRYIEKILSIFNLDAILLHAAFTHNLA